MQSRREHPYIWSPQVSKQPYFTKNALKYQYFYEIGHVWPPGVSQFKNKGSFLKEILSNFILFALFCYLLMCFQAITCEIIGKTLLLEAIFCPNIHVWPPGVTINIVMRYCRTLYTTGNVFNFILNAVLMSLVNFKRPKLTFILPNLGVLLSGETVSVLRYTAKGHFLDWILPYFQKNIVFW